MLESGGDGGSGHTWDREDFNQPSSSSTYINPQHGEWIHLAITSTSTSSAAGTVKLYVNGAEVESMTGKQYTGTSTESSPTLGARFASSSTSYHFTGNMDQVAIYQRALSASDVADLCGPDNYQRKPHTPYLSSGDPIHLWACGENVTGSTMPDQIGSLDMTLYNSPTVSTSVAPAPYASRWSTKFDGTDDYLKSTSSPIDATGAFSVSLWVKVTTPQGAGSENFFSLSDSSNWYRRLVIDKFRSGSGATERVAFRVATTDGVGGSSSSRSVYSGYGDADIGKWRHIVVTCSATSSAAGDAYIYLDGTPSPYGPASMDQLGAGASIDEAVVGAYRHLGNGGIYKWLDGHLDEISCWPRVLSQAEITALYNSGNPTDPMNTTGVTADAVAYYRMGERWNRGVVPDVIGSADLTMSSAPVPVRATPNWQAPSSSIAFDGTDDYALTADMAASIPQGAHTVSWWMKAVAPAPNWDAYVWSGPTGAVAYQYHRALVASSSTFSQLRDSDGTGVSGVTQTTHTPYIQDGTWQHWCYTCAATSSSTGDIVVYVNGQAEITRTGAPAWLSTADFVLYLARWGTYVGDYSECNIAEVTVWDYELSGTQVSNLYNSGTPTNPQDTTGISTDPVHYWRMGSDMSGSTTVLDRIGGVNLELHNGAAASPDVP